MCECFAYKNVCVPHLCLVPMPEKGIRSPLYSSYIDSCEMPCGCYELNLGSIEASALNPITEPITVDIFSFNTKKLHKTFLCHPLIHFAVFIHSCCTIILSKMKHYVLERSSLRHRLFLSHHFPVCTLCASWHHSLFFQNTFNHYLWKSSWRQN